MDNQVDILTESLLVFDKPYVDIMGIRLTEPMTAITDVILASVCLYYYIHLKRNERKSETKFWKFFFLWLSISTLIGALVHGFYIYFSESSHKLIWLIMQVCSGLAVYFAENSTIRYFFMVSRRKLLLNIIAIKMLLMVLATFYFQHFSVVVINTAIGFLTIFYFKMNLYVKGDSASGFIAGGIVLAICTGIIHANKWSINIWFNHNDISHVIMIFSVWLMYVGVLKIQDQDTVKSVQ